MKNRFNRWMLIAAVLTLCGCARPPIKEELTFLMWGDVNEIKSVRKSLAQFQNLNPGIFVRIIHARGADEYRTKFQTMFAGGIPPDVMYVEATDFPAYVQKNIFLNLQPFVEKDARFRVEDYYPQLIKLFRYKSRLYGVPKDFATLVLYYNVSMFEKLGVEFPAPDWGWQDLLEAAGGLTADLDGDGKIDRFGIEVNPHISRWAAFLRQNGGKILEESTGTWVIGSKDYLEKNTAAFQFLRDLIYKFRVSPSPSMAREQRLFETGRVGMTFAGRWMCLRFKEIKDFRWDIAELPRGKKRASVLFTVCYAISKKCKNPDAAWKLLKFMAGKQGQIETANSGHAIPSLISVAESDYFLKAKELPAELNHIANINTIFYARALPLHPDWLLARDTIQRNVEKIFLSGSPDITGILKSIQDELKETGRSS